MMAEAKGSRVNGFHNLRQFIEVLRQRNLIVDIHSPVDPNLELAEIHRRVIAANGPALLFHRVKGSPFPVVTNLFGTLERVSIAFRNRPEDLIANAVKLATRDFPPSLKNLWEQRRTIRSLMKVGMRKRRRAPILECSSAPDLEKLPMLTSWPEDGGPFITLPLVYTEPPEGGPPNLGMYRIQRYDKSTCGLHWQIAKGGGHHFHQAEQLNQPLPVTIFIGGPPALILSAIAPLPENVPELLLCSLLQGDKLATGRDSTHSHPLIAECEFALAGEALPHTRRPEGPFGDHYGYYSLKHDFPVFNCQKLFHRKDAIYPATVVGKPRQEDFYIGDYLQELLSPLFPVVMPGVKNLWSYGETGFHALSAAIIKERYDRESMSSAFRILGEGQLSLTKFLLMTDQQVDLKNFPALLTTVLERFRPEKDLFIFSNLCLDTLDYTGPELNKGSRGILLGTGEKVRDLPTTFRGELPRPLSKAIAFSPGCLVLETPPFEKFSEFQHLLEHKDFQKWPLLILVDDAEKATLSTANFLWTTFTRFEPAADIYSKEAHVFRHHLCYDLPLLIDARMKPSYPKEVLCDDQTSDLVTRRWSEYFPKGMEMGNSRTAHVC